MNETDIGLPELPNGWVWTTVRSAIEKVPLGKKKLKQKNYEEVGKLPVIDQGLSFIGGYTNHEELKVECQLPIVVFGDHTKVFKYVDFDFVAGADGIKVIRPQEMYYPKLFYYFARAISLPEKGYARHFQFLEKAQIPLPPLPEQHRIVAKIEELFTKLDAGINELHKAQAQLKRYPQSVLKAAFGGKLTEAWRAKHLDKIKPATLITGDLPDGWVRTKLEEISEIILGQSPPSSTYNIDQKGLPFYQGKHEFGETYPTPQKWCAVPKKIAEKGDVLISVRAPVGPTNLCPEKSCIGRGLAAIRGLNGIEPFFILYLMRAYEDELAGRGTGTTFNAIRGNQLKTFEIPVPPIPEQQVIVSEVERYLSIADKAEKTFAAELKRAEQLRQSILKKAFSGKLVPQDPNDEPASVLLERIRAEKSQQTQGQLRLRSV